MKKTWEDQLSFFVNADAEINYLDKQCGWVTTPFLSIALMKHHSSSSCKLIRLDIARVSEDHKDLPDDRILQTFQDTVDTRCFYERNSHVEHPGGEEHV